MQIYCGLIADAHTDFQLRLGTSMNHNKVHDISCVLKDVNDKNEKNLPTKPRIEVSHFIHPNVPILTEDSVTSKGDVLTNPLGILNPVFELEEASSPGKSTPDESTTVFDFNDVNIKEYEEEKKNEEAEKNEVTVATPHVNKISVLPRRGSYTPGSSLAEKTSLAVPSIHNIRRPSDPFTVQKEGKHHPGNLQSLTTVSIDSLSVGGDGKYPPLSPGYLSINGNDSYFPPPSPGLLSTNSAWSELAKIHSRRSSFGDFNENSSRATSRTWSNVSSSLSEHLHNLVRAFSSRTEKVKEATVQPPTPSSLSEDFDGNSDVNSAYSGLDEPPQRERRLGSFIPGHSSNNPLEDQEEKYYLDWGCCKSRAPRWCKHLQIPSTLEAQSKIYMSWLFLVTLTFMYNAWVIPLRGTFQYQTDSNLVYWLICDYVSDFIYILDVFLVKPRLRYLESGIMVTDTKLTRKNYTKKLMFKFDLLALLPLDLLYLVTGVIPWLRFPRILKIQTFWEFYEKCDQAVRSAHVLRIIKTMTYMMYLIHIETCGYYFVSWYEGFESNRWVYNGKGIAYIRCFYLATKTATSIGNNPKPTNVLEYVFMVIYWLSGVFVFALLIGQIRDIAEAAGRIKTLYNKRMDAALWYVKNLNLPKETQDRVRTWFIYNWEQTKILDEKALMDWLPKNLRTDLAIHVHFQTLSKVKLFSDCDKSLLYDLVLKLKPILYLPGDLVCRKGEVGKEMYIVSQGQVDVVGGPDNSIVLATLKEGSVFGEISLLAFAEEGNRRTADVVCKGFTNLFILSKTDFEAAMSEYPEAHKLLRKRAKKLMQQNKKLLKEKTDSTENSSKIETQEIIHSPKHNHYTPKLVRTVIQVLNPETSVAKRLHSSMSNRHQAQKLPDSDNSDDSTGSGEGSSGSNQSNGRVSKIKHLKKGNQIKAEEMSQKSTFSKSDSKKELKMMKDITNNLPNADEVEKFYDEMLAIDRISLDPPGKTKHILKRNDTVQTEQSEDSADSGVQMVKAQSPTESSSKTMSNKDSKDSFMSSEIAEMFDDTRTWIVKQVTNRLGLDQDKLSDFFEDNIHNDDNTNVKQDITNTGNTIVKQDIANAGNTNVKQDIMNSEKVNVKQDITNDGNTNVKQDITNAGNTNVKQGIMNSYNANVKQDIAKNEKTKTVINDKKEGGSGKELNVKSKMTDVKNSNESTKCQEKGTQVKQAEIQPKQNFNANNTKSVKAEDSSLKVKVIVPRVRPRKPSEEITVLESDVQETNKLSSNRRTWRQPSVTSSISSDCDRNNALLSESLNVGDPFENPEGQEKKETIQMNGIPHQNQITCSVEVHREKSLTPASLLEWLDNSSMRKRKESTVSQPTENFETSV